MEVYCFGSKEAKEGLDLKSECACCKQIFYYSEDNILCLLRAFGKIDMIKCPSGCTLAFGKHLPDK